MEGKSYHYLVLFTGLFLCLLHSGGASSSCDNINPIDFAEITYDEPEGLASHPDGTVANIGCGVFYQIVPTDFERTTCTNGSWTEPLPRCRHIPRYCQRHVALVESYGRDCQTPCRQRPNGGCPPNKRCHCDGVCGWSCISIYEDNFCPEVAHQAGLLVTYDTPERRFNGYANFSCGEGYIYHSGSSRLRCMSNRQWGGGNEFLCIPNVVCRDPPSAEHASLQPSGKQYFLPGDTRSYTCNLGYIIRGSRDITCGDDYGWSEPDFTCRPRPCTYPGRISNADLTTQLFQFKERAIYVCREGYENPPYTLPYRTCQANGQWTQILPICEPIQCPAILDIANGNVDSRGNDFDSQIYFTCNDGYRLDGTARRVCQGDKTWSGQEAVCTEIICEDLGVPVNGYMANEKQVYHLDDVVYYHCNRGKTLDGSILNSCTESGEWRYPVPICGGPCIVPPYPRDGWWQNANEYPLGTSVPHNTRLQLTCSSWRFDKRRSSVKCNDGVWSDSDDVHRLCQGTPCGVRWSIDVALNITYDPPISDEDRFNHRIQHDTRVHYDCAWGYRLQGVTESRCEQGRYNNNIPRCELVPCSAPEDVSHGRLTYTNPDGVPHENPLHGDTRLLQCGFGYRSRSFNSSRCDNGVWVEGSHDIRCYPKPCDPIPDTMGHVNYTRTAKANGKYIHGTEVTVNCNSGYLPAYGNGTAVCNASQWLTVIPMCTQSRNIILDSHTNVSQTPPKRNQALIGNAWLARDGNTDSAPQYCSRTKVTINPWWKAVMKNIYDFTHVKIYNRLDREEHILDLEGAEIRVGLDADYATNLLCGEPITRRQIERSTEANHGIQIICVGEGDTGIRGNVISVHIPTINNQRRELSLCEIEVYQQGLSISVKGAKDGARVGCVVPHVENAVVSSTNVAIQQVLLEGDEVRISCHARHVLRGSDTSHIDLTCLGNSSWDQDKPVCEPKTCTVDSLNNGSFPHGKLLYNHGENITFTCNSGYQKEKDRYWCDAGIAVPRNPRCIQASCHAPDFPDHMVTSQSEPHFPHGTLLDVSCEDGFQLSTNQEQLRCFRGGWSTPLTATCQRVPCGHPVRASGSTIEILTWKQGYVHGTRVRYSCSEGWEIEGIAERECVNGQWTGSTPTCRVAAPPRCMLPDRSSGQRYSIRGFIGNIFDEGLPIGERVSISVSCNQGYTAQPAVQTECLERGVWSVAVPICVRMERLCTKPGYISHVVQYVNGLETNRLDFYPHDELPEGTFLVSRCSLPGQYVLRGSANRTCSESSWTGVQPSCVDADTRIVFQNNQPLDVRSNGTIVIHPRSRLYLSCRVPSHNTARFVSDNGPFAVYQDLSTMVMDLYPPRTIHSGWFTCRSNDYTLSHTVYVQFAEIFCDRPTTPTNGAFQDHDYYGWKNGRYYMGKVITFACNDGYILDGERRITCVLGKWSHPAPRCQRHRATCEELHPPTHGTKIGGNRIGDSVLIGCNQGYQLQGEPFLDCQESGNWSHPLPACIEIIEPERPCDSVSCGVWQKCETDSSGVGVCRCISPNSCPVTNETEVCGTDGRNYTNFCRLKALACIRNTGVEVASRTWFCINGVPEHALLTPTPFIEIEKPSQLSSFESSYEESPPSIPEPTLPATEGPVLEPDTPSSRSYSFCHLDECPSSSAAELSQGATAIVIAYADNWDADLGILRIQIYEVMAGGMPSWTEDSYQDVLIDVGAASERGCLCPSFQATDPVIIRFSQHLRHDEKGQLLHTDIVLPYSTDLYHEIRLLLEEPVRVQTPAPQTPRPQDETSDSFSSLGSHDGPEGQNSWFQSDSDIITTTARTNTEIVDSPRSSESSFDT
ncbi:sushi, von Willebrand factor type A, EGF and pentraxin domain-containing protein 1 [Strongylocentrotus purpuratus]|uniref:Sushi, von Willebrand factor type A, EGF and pentraxin domain-containing protein 1 n=1 Tax=Strongylocentrotus purpuratus TaxID=7668 RepID=A0A7M7PKK5_STRPU|nr:sushi, von Willebrand factor type A, EGF and pentraxin domain-containing protein 1 [Strongylocentrotus purpuratus]